MRGTPSGARFVYAYRSRQQGFTLLELMVVLAVFGLILAALTGGLRVVMKTWQSQQRAHERDADIGAVQNSLDRLIEPSWKFSGDGQSLKFYGTLPHVLAIPGLYKITLSRLDNQLVLDWQSALEASPPPDTSGHAVLIDAITDMTIEYLYRSPGKPDAAWLNATDDRQSGPALIRIRVSFDPASERHWPTQIICPAITPAQAPGG